jgi:F-type H+-transporting ATPase subunit b
MMLEPEFWVAVAFVLFCAVLVYLGVHRKVIAALDERQGRIRSELNEARRLKDEAQSLLDHYAGKRREVEDEAQAIIAGAKLEAERLAAEAETKLKHFIALRTKVVEGRIAQAEADALAEVRMAATEAAVGAAEIILSQVPNETSERLFDQGIRQIKDKLN